MTTPDHGARLRLLFDWAHEDGRRLALWVVVAIALHAVAWVLFQTRYPHPEPAEISDASLYALLPGSPEAKRLAPLLASADPSLAAPERDERLGLPEPRIPEYEPSYEAAAPELLPLPDPPTRILPPLLRDLGPVPMAETPAASAPLPAPATASQVLFSVPLAGRAPQEWPKVTFTARPGDLLATTRFLIAVAPDGRVLHVLRDEASVNDSLDDTAARLLMRLKFLRSSDASIVWGTATFHWGTDVKRVEPRGETL